MCSHHVYIIIDKAFQTYVIALGTQLTQASESITVQFKARVTRAAKTAHSVSTHLITATIVSQTLINVCNCSTLSG